VIDVNKSDFDIRVASPLLAYFINFTIAIVEETGVANKNQEP
jgi:hypothetical protein